MFSTEEVNVLGQILDSTWGKSSTISSPTMSIKASLSGGTLSVSYVTVVHLASERNLRDQVKVFEDESIKITNEFMKNLKKQFKEGSGRVLKAKSLGTSDSVEMITSSPFTPRKTAYYRRFTNFECE